MEEGDKGAVLVKLTMRLLIRTLYVVIQPEASESHNNGAGGQQEGLYCVNVNASECIRCHKDGKFHNKKQCV